MSSLRVLIIQIVILLLMSTSCTTTTAGMSATATSTLATSPTSASTPKVTNTPYPTWNPKLEDTWLTGTEDCQPPCWKGIIPGETTYEEALNVFQRLGFINSEGYIDPGEFDIGEDKTYIKWIRGDGKLATLYFFENKVFLMCFSMLRGDLGLVVDQFGEPDGYTVFYNDPGAYEVQVFYPNYGLVLIGYMRTTEMISQDTFVDTFYILSPEDPEYFYDSYIDNINKLYKEDPGSNEWPIYYEWEGFGVYPKDKFP